MYFYGGYIKRKIPVTDICSGDYKELGSNPMNTLDAISRSIVQIAFICVLCYDL